MCQINLALRVDKILGSAGKQGDTKIPVNTLEDISIYRNESKISTIEIIYLD